MFRKPFSSLSFAAAAFVALSTGDANAAQNGSSVLIPAGTTLRVRTIDPIDADVSQTGAKFRGTLDDPVMMNGNVVLPRGADVVMVATKVKEGGNIKGKAEVALKVNAISVRGRMAQVVTSEAKMESASEGKKSTKKILGGAGLGAAIGGLAGGGTGAGIGALIGVTAGTVASASTKARLKIPPETRLDFQLLSDWRIHP